MQKSETPQIYMHRVLISKLFWLNSMTGSFSVIALQKSHLRELEYTNYFTSESI